LAKLSVRTAQKDEVRAARFDKLQEYLLAESKHWLTPENYKEKITDDLFKKPCTTGVVDKSSEMWRHYIKPFSLNRVLQQIWEDPAEGDLDSLKTRLEKRAHKTTIRQDGIRHLINGMIGTGHDRERYSELVDSFSTWHEQAEGSERTQHLNKYADDSNFPEIPDMTKQDLQDILGNPFVSYITIILFLRVLNAFSAIACSWCVQDEFENARLKQELDSMLEDGQRLGDAEAAGSSGRAKKDFFPVDDDSDGESDSDSDNEKQAVSAKSAPAKAAKKGVARAALRSRDEEDEEDSRLAAIARLTEQPVESDGEEESSGEGEEGEMFASAESSSVDELIADLAYVNPDDETALRAMYQKIKLHALNQQKF
jgi:hypothetical protein